MGQQPSKDEHGKPRPSLASCACCARCFSRAGLSSSPRALQSKRLSATQALVVEDESWKKWSSYNLIHHPPGGAGAATTSHYRPPAFVSPAAIQTVAAASASDHAPSPKAEAVWEL